VILINPLIPWVTRSTRRDRHTAGPPKPGESNNNSLGFNACSVIAETHPFHRAAAIVSISTSPLSRRERTLRPASVFRSSDAALVPIHNQERADSPELVAGTTGCVVPPVISTLMTSAPISRSSIEHAGPAMTCDRSIPSDQHALSLLPSDGCHRYLSRFLPYKQY